MKLSNIIYPVMTVTYLTLFFWGCRSTPTQITLYAIPFSVETPIALTETKLINMAKQTKDGVELLVTDKHSIADIWNRLNQLTPTTVSNECYPDPRIVCVITCDDREDTLSIGRFQMKLGQVCYKTDTLTLRLFKRALPTKYHSAIDEVIEYSK